MRKLILSAAAAIALATVPALAQETDNDAKVGVSASTGSLTADRQAIVASWPADRQTMYSSWSPEYQTYFWTLTPEEQQAYFVLTPTQREQIAAMTPTQRSAAWQSIVRQLAAGANNSDTSVAARTGGEVPAPAQATPADDAASGAGAVVTSVPGNLEPPPASALNKHYPVCSRTVQDQCQNPGEGGAPGRSRALKYWPGKPASEGK
uniref:hypothetical protein n=1 Tax=Altererythrobacter segetis TaxID=1104773 RepID=UPI001A9C57D1|nr:hypothetical protein [Altererythrobacter segetis]